ncbi:MAG: hypothetical protein GC182_08630 [Rhodopseudomonas sp.]|nr:hypothetical protein [Rhodopseudomonas sp.]
MKDSPDLIERLCRSLAFHLVESELTLQFAEGELSEWQGEVAAAKALIIEAGFDLDDLYPIADRPVVHSEQ